MPWSQWRKHNIKRVYVPAEDAAEAALIGGIDILPVTTLRQLVMHLNDHPLAMGSITPYQAEPSTNEGHDTHYPVDMSHIKGQEHVKRALEVAAAGAHSIFLSGPPLAGKTLLARCTPTILPAPTIKSFQRRIFDHEVNQ